MNDPNSQATQPIAEVLGLNPANSRSKNGGGLPLRSASRSWSSSSHSIAAMTNKPVMSRKL
ncbi:MAG: hypothetical protein Q8L79_05285 [Methylobacter sp.]|uniref:hypothetical protein n=1 Tax=Methylobacter sp. TaxID=2051955 RepID=UPI00272FEDF0|nr:hypothetical protein [Methylobacter sp.]MDP1664523.1 hypothetical protein [Methylobacter sp.]